MYLQFSGRKTFRRSSTASWYTKLQLIKLFVNCWYRLKNCPVTFELWSGNAIFAGHSKVQRTFGTGPKKRPRRKTTSHHFDALPYNLSTDVERFMHGLCRALRNMSLHCALPTCNGAGCALGLILTVDDTRLSFETKIHGGKRSVCS